MKIKVDPKRALEVGTQLIKSYKKGGILGIKRLPDDIVPDGIIGGSPEHLLFITFVSFISYMQIATKFWENARKTFSDDKTKIIFFPENLDSINDNDLTNFMSKYNLINKRVESVKIWRKLGETLFKDFNSNPLDIFLQTDYEVSKIFKYMNSQIENLFPKNIVHEREFLLWIMRIRLNTGLILKDLEKIPLPVTFHTIRATLNTGIISGNFKMKTVDMVKYVQKVWAEACHLKENVNNYVPLDFEKFLWILSRYGCLSFKKNGKCEATKICPVGKFEVDADVQIANDFVIVNTNI
jgi:hypothetical protein